MDFDILTLSRLQFALTVMFHYLFPPLSIGLGFMMVVMEAMYMKTGNRQYETIARFWTGIFAIVFAMGVASGIVMEFQFGTNWAGYSRFVGDVFGSALAAEGIFAFFLESGFLAVLVFGWDKVSARTHFFSTIMVALGAMFSAVWITVANSWQQTPAGHHIVTFAGRSRAEIVDFRALVFNPSSIHRLLHVYIGALILGSFFVLSISSFYLLKGRHVEAARKMFKLALPVGLAVSLLAPISGHFQARRVAETQPAKLAAFEGLFETGKGATGLSLFGIPDEKTQTVRYEIQIPGLLSLLVHGNTTTPVTGLDRIPRDNRPPVLPSFVSYHVMVGLGMGFIVLTALATLLWWRGSLFRTRWLLWVFVFSVVGPYVANELGWVAAELGRQPWIVQGLFRTADGVSPALHAGQILASLFLFTVLYVLLFFIWLYVMHTKIVKGPEAGVETGGAPRKEGLLDAASELADPSGPSLTDAREKGSGAAGKE
jgi:cytochrome d ubiquinol oxidase subunit I